MPSPSNAVAWPGGWAARSSTKEAVTRAIALVLVALLIPWAHAGCSVYKVASQPPPADLAGIGVGAPRGQLIAKLGAPKFSDTDSQGQKQDTFEFESRFHSASKLRIIPYLAADLVTLGLAELILWPLEMTMMDKAKCIGTATYDPTLKVSAWTVNKKTGVQGC